MKILIAYYSQGGNTDYAARRVAEETGGDLLRLEPVKAYPASGFMKFFWGGKSAVMAETPPLAPYRLRPADYDVIAVGFPVWAGNMAPPIRTFLKENDLSGKRVAAFACQSGSGAEKAFAKLTALLGGGSLFARAVFIDPKDKPSIQNEEALKSFCRALTAPGR